MLNNKSLVRYVSISCLCLSLSNSAVFAMDENAADKPIASRVLPAAQSSKEKNTETNSAASSNVTSPALIIDHKAALQTMIETCGDEAKKILKWMAPLRAPEDQKPHFEKIATARREINILLGRLAGIESAHSTSTIPEQTEDLIDFPDPDSKLSSPLPPAPPSSPQDSSPEHIKESIRIRLKQLMTDTKEAFGFTTPTWAGPPRFSDSFHTNTLKTLKAKEGHYREEATSFEERSTLFKTFTGLANLFETAHDSITNRKNDVSKDLEKFEACTKVGLSITGYYLKGSWTDMRALTVTPLNYKLFASVMALVDETLRKIGDLQGGEYALGTARWNTLVAPYDASYIVAALLSQTEEVPASRTVSTSS